MYTTGWEVECLSIYGLLTGICPSNLLSIFSARLKFIKLAGFQMLAILELNRLIIKNAPATSDTK
jgi:hypothetical protein